MKNLCTPRLKNLLFFGITFVILTLSWAKNLPSHNYFVYGVKVIPHPDKKDKGGEDSYFASNFVLAVSDGVGGWARHGIDPTRYSKALCINVENILKKNELRYINKPKALLKQAAEQNPFEGSSTLVITNLDKEKPILRTSYIGDSIYVIYRKEGNNWKLIFEAEEQQRSFNAPYQLGNMGGFSTPDMAKEFEHNVKDKDILVVASDGLFDNLDSDQVLKDLLDYIDDEDEIKKPKKAAIKLANHAFELSLDKKYNSPFAKRAKKAGVQFMGGKSDDITVVVGQIRLKENEKESEKPGPKINHDL